MGARGNRTRGRPATDYNLRYVRGGFAVYAADCITQVIGRCPILRDTRRGQTALAGWGPGVSLVQALVRHAAQAWPVFGQAVPDLGRRGGALDQ